MEVQELKSYLKACIDAYQTTEEIPKIIESIDKKISEVNLAREEFPLKPAEVKVKVFRGKTKEQYVIDYFSDLLTDLLYDDDILPDEVTVTNLKDNTTRKFSKKTSFSFGPVFISKNASKLDYSSYKRFFVDELTKYKRIELIGPDVCCYAGVSDTAPQVKFSFNHGFKKHLESAWKKAQEQAEIKIKENEIMAPAYQEKYVKEAENYKINAKKYNDAQIIKQQKEDERVAREQLKVDLMKKESDAFNQNLATSKNALSQLLNTNVLHPKYRSYVCICSLFDYIDTGRCTELTGPFGAYQRYEEDLKAGHIIGSLGRIEGRLDQIISNQASLAYSIESSTRRISRTIEDVGERVNNSLARIESNQYSIRNDLAAVGSGVAETNNRLAESNRILAEYGKDSAATRYSVERIAKLQEYVGSVRFANGEFKGFEYRYPF